MPSAFGSGPRPRPATIEHDFEMAARTLIFAVGYAHKLWPQVEEAIRVRQTGPDDEYDLRSTLRQDPALRQHRYDTTMESVVVQPGFKKVVYSIVNAALRSNRGPTYL